MADPRRRQPRPAAGRRADDRTFPPTVEYAALRDLPAPVRVTLAYAVLPLDVVVTSVRILKNVEMLLGEVAVQLRALRPAVAAAGQAYADGRFDPILDTVDDVREHGTGAVAVVRAPFATIREVVLGPAAEVDEVEVLAVDPPPPPTLTGWLGGLGGEVGRRLGVVGSRAPDGPADGGR
jgi:hypothetical protein